MSRRIQFSLWALLVTVLLAGAVCGLLRLLLVQEETLILTNEPFDIAIAEGDGFFAFADTQTKSVLYTRCCHLALNASGQLVFGSPDSGLIMQPPLTLPTTTIGLVFTGEGAVWIQHPGENFLKVGQLQLARFANPQGLSRVD